MNQSDEAWIDEALKEGDNMFLPDNYEVPQSESGYMKLQQGENRFRIMSSPILGYEWWVEEDGKRKPMRVPMDGKVPSEFADEYKHFWAMVVWNYKASKIQILEITQKTIQAAIKNIARSKWGDPKGKSGYDFVVTREGEKLETEYTIIPEPKEELSEEIVKAYKDSNINLEALYEGGDPFKTEE